MNTKSHEKFIAANGRDHLCLFRRDGGGYLVTCPELPPMITYGETLDEARANDLLRASSPTTAPRGHCRTPQSRLQAEQGGTLDPLLTDIALPAGVQQPSPCLASLPRPRSGSLCNWPRSAAKSFSTCLLKVGVGS
jgi:hypothetical protein